MNEQNHRNLGKKGLGLPAAQTMAAAPVKPGMSKRASEALELVN
jgi:hypothetical protein